MEFVPSKLPDFSTLFDAAATVLGAAMKRSSIKERLRRSSARASREYLIEPCNRQDTLMLFYACLFEHLQTQTFLDYDPMDYLALWKSNNEDTE
jgi:hypothetical protein